MQIKNSTNRKLDFQVASQSSKTLWTGSVDPGTSTGKDLPEADAPFTATARWPADPPLPWNFIPPTGTGNVPKNSDTVTVTEAFPSFFAHL
jgi:hypothetical protein